MLLNSRYFYILKFSAEPLVKIGIGTRNDKLTYDRIKQHQITYGKIFDLKNSYEILVPKEYSISAFERNVKDITALYIPTLDLLSKYTGKGGYTEIRTLDSLDLILNFVKFQKQYVNLQLKQGINLSEHKKGLKLKKIGTNISKKEKALAKEIIDFPFAYINQEHKIELALGHSYEPNLHKVNAWSFDEKKDLYLKIDANKSFLRDLYLDYNSWMYNEDENCRSSNDIDLYLHSSLWQTGISQYSINGQYNYSIFVYAGVMIEKEQDHVIINFSLGKLSNDDEVFEKYKKWFKAVFVDPLLDNIGQRRVEPFEFY